MKAIETLKRIAESLGWKMTPDSGNMETGNIEYLLETKGVRLRVNGKDDEETADCIRTRRDAIHRLLNALADECDPQTLVCSECGSTAVQMRAWVDANTEEFRSDCDSDDTDDYWCEECQAHNRLVLRSDFEKKMDEWAREHGIAWREDATYERKRKTYNELKKA